MPVMDKDLVHGCGKVFKYPKHYAAHGMKCDGTKPETSGRIAAAAKVPDRTPPARKRSAVKPKSKPRGHAKPPMRREATRSASNGHDAAMLMRPADFLAALRAERDKIDVAIRAVEALA